MINTNTVFPNLPTEVDGSLGLGELAQLTVNNESDGAYDANSKDGTGGSAGGAGYRKTWNAKYTLRSHFDGVRSLIFSPRGAGADHGFRGSYA